MESILILLLCPSPLCADPSHYRALLLWRKRHRACYAACVGGEFYNKVATRADRSDVCAPSHSVLCRAVCSLCHSLLQLLAGGHLKWDWAASRSAYFPHLYDLEGGIQKQHIKQVQRLAYDEATKKHIVPQLE